MFFIIFSIAFIVAFVLWIIPAVINVRYKRFVSRYSLAIKQIKQINKKYKFNNIKSLHLKNSYDNEDYYDEISTSDYMTYVLADIQNEVKDGIKSARENQRIYKRYLGEISNTLEYNVFETNDILHNRKKLAKYEKKIVKSFYIKPKLHFEIAVTLYLTKINGRYRDRKSNTYTEDMIEGIIKRLNIRSGTFYHDKDIWQSLCKVERGKVSNKMRFAIYERDGHRCCKCGRRSGRLEIDHIYPISKGGKSTYDNLQTLCHKCNYEKSDSIVMKYKNCPYCGGTVVVKNGKYGKFYGCKNYPDCRFIEKY